jgi:hypothetical protein
MRKFVTIVGIGGVVRAAVLTTSLLSASAVAAGQPPARRAAVTPHADRAACLDQGRLLSHAAYLPTATDDSLRCGHLLSTDTLLKVRHWGQT